jgi:hypothetical protein
MIEHKLSNKTKSATVVEPKLFHQLNNPYDVLARPQKYTLCVAKLRSVWFYFVKV